MAIITAACPACKGTGTILSPTPKPTRSALPQRSSAFLKWTAVKPGEVLEGTWRGTRQAEGEHGAFALGELTTDAGKGLTFSISTGLRPIEAAQIGARVRIIYNGQGTSKRGYHFFKFSIFEQAAGGEWQEIPS